MFTFLRLSESMAMKQQLFWGVGVGRPYLAKQQVLSRHVFSYFPA